MKRGLMKKLLSLILVLSFVITLTACGNETKDNTNNSTDNGSQGTQNNDKKISTVLNQVVIIVHTLMMMA